METHGPPGGNCTLQSMKSNSRLFRKYFCRRKICFTFLGPLCIPISFSGAALVDMLSIQGHVHIKYILSYLPFCPMWIFINRSVQQTLSILVMVLPTLSPAVCLFLFRPEEKHLQQLLFFIYLWAKAHKCCYVFTLKQAMKEICLAVQQELKRSVERISFGSLVVGSKNGPSPGCCSSNAVTPAVRDD